MAKIDDKFANRSFVDITMSAANTITFQQIRFAVGTFQGVGLKLARIEYYPTSGTFQEVVAAADSFSLALVVRDDLTSLDPSSQGIISLTHVFTNGATTNKLWSNPYTHDFTRLPEGGLLIPPNPLFAAMTTSGFAAAGRFRAILYYTFLELSDRESIELLQTLLPGNV